MVSIWNSVGLLPPVSCWRFPPSYDLGICGTRGTDGHCGRVGTLYAHTIHAHHRPSELSDSEAFCSSAWYGHHIANERRGKWREKMLPAMMAAVFTPCGLHVSLLFIFTMWLTRLLLPARYCCCSAEWGVVLTCFDCCFELDLRPTIV